MKEYLEILTVILMTAITIGIVGLIAAGFYMIYKTIKENYFTTTKRTIWGRFISLLWT